MEEKKQRLDLMRTVSVKRTEVQEKYVNRIKAYFNPLNILQLDKAVHRKTTIKSQLGEFDAIWQFEISGRKFEQVENPLKIGVLESVKSYIIVFYKDGKAAITLWRGKNQTTLNYQNAILLFKETKFRLVQNNRRL